jgi:hypothetical protein
LRDGVDRAIVSRISQETLPFSDSRKIAEPARRVMRMLDSAMELFDRHVKIEPSHGNEQLHFRGMIGTLLAAAFEPAVRSLRTIDELSLREEVKAVSGMDRVARSTLSDAMARFDPQRLRPMVEALRRQLPQLDRFDGQTAGVVRRIVAADGSWFNLAGEVAHALHCRRGRTPRRQSRVRWNLQLDVEAFLPDEFDVSGSGDGSEAAAFARSIQGGCIYLLDRNFVHFGFIRAVLAKESSFVLRLKKSVHFATQSSSRLSDKDLLHHVLKDEIGTLSGPVSHGNKGRPGRTGQPPPQTLRRVTVWDPVNGKEVVLLTDILDVPAYVIGELYRLRWQIELFFRWLKVLAGFDHLCSQSTRGITMQFYVAVLMTLLIHLHSGGRRVSKYALLWVSWIAQERATPQQMAEGLARRERERMLERARLAKKKWPVV